MPLHTRLNTMLGIQYPIVQAGMSWASSNAALPAAVSEAGGLGVIAAGPMYPEALEAAIRALRAITAKPFAVNIPLYNKRAADYVAIALAEQVPVIIASQGGPQKYLARFKDAGVTWLQVAASPMHAAKAEQAGVDGIIAVGLEAGGHPGPDEIGTLVLVRAIASRVSIPIIAAGGIADGAGIAAALCLGADGAQLGTRFMMTPEAAVHPAYKAAVQAAGVADTTLVGRGRSPIRMLKNAFSQAYQHAEGSAAGDDDLNLLFASRSLKQAALDGDVADGKTEAGQSAGLIDDIVPAGDLLRRLVAETEAALDRAASMR